ncbi:MAG TPA: hypothetical protein VHE35_37445, partial [Kofleriaceae bacterium]|nr:hypothetical protein [Kofleriaceae bacterium]
IGSVAVAVLRLGACGTSGTTAAPPPVAPPPVDAAPARLTPVPARADPPVEPGPAHATQLAAGANHVCARMSDDTLRCWGGNDWGQLGNGTVELTKDVVTPALAGVVEVSAGYGFTCARLRDHTVRCFGTDDEGELGVASPTEPDANHAIPTPTAVPGLTDAVQLSSTTKHSCAVRRDGTVACWGDDRYGELGGAHRSTGPGIVQVAGLDGVTQVAAGDFTCARRVDGTAWCWGTNMTPAARPVAGLSAVAELAMGELFGCARDDRGDVTCWGAGDSGQLGHADGEPQAPVAGLHGASALALGSDDACAIAGGKVQCWGADWVNPDFPAACLRLTAHTGGGGAPAQWHYCPTPAPVRGITAPVALAAGDAHVCALTAAHDVLCWGQDGTPRPTRVPL